MNLFEDKLTYLLVFFLAKGNLLTVEAMLIIFMNSVLFNRKYVTL